MKSLLGWRFILLTLIVIIIQFSLLRVILNNGFTADDWLLLFDYKTIGYSGNFFDRLFAIFNVKGVYTTYQVVYIGILENIFNNNYQAYQITNIIFKILATVSLYPLVLIIFKNRSLAFLTTILYGISYSSTGALQFVVKGSDYLAIFLMNICLISYYLSFKIRKRQLLFTTAILLFLAFIFSPIRIYPLLLFIFFAEIFIWIKFKGLSGLRTSLLRLFLIFSPFFIVFLLLPKSTGGYLNGPLVVYQLLSYGNYQLLLSPFAGFGYTFLTNDYFQIFGSVNFDNFYNYLIFLLKGPLIIYSILAILLGFLLSKKQLLFSLGVILVNLAFEIICYFFVTNLRDEVGPNVKGFYPISIYAIFLGFFVISVAFSAFWIWLKHKSNILLTALFIGPIFSNAFLWGTWFIIGDALTFKEGIHWYLIIPPIGSSLFLSSLILLAFNRIKKIFNPRLRYILIGFLFLVIPSLYLISNKEINTTFTYLTNIGYGASEQEEIKRKLLSHLKYPLDVRDTLFYLDTTEEFQNPLFYPVTLISGFEKKMHFRNFDIINGCVGLIIDKDSLRKSVVTKNDVKGFNANSLCVENYSGVGTSEIFYRVDNFYAFKLKDKEVIDIKEDVLEELKF